MQAKKGIASCIVPSANEWSLRLQAIARELAMPLFRLWTAVMLRRAIRFVESSPERDCRNINLRKAEIRAVVRCLLDGVADGSPTACS